MDKNCVTLETARKLKAAGFPQTTAFYWAVTMTTNPHLSWYDGELPEALDGRAWAAASAQEIADQFRDFGLMTLAQYGGRWEANLSGTPSGAADTIAEVLALLWLKVHEAK